MPKTFKLLQVENLNTSFRIDAGRVLAVNGVSFDLEKGEVLGIVGESGSGKSVTAYSIMRILDQNGSIDSGKIVYNGTDLLKLTEKQMRSIRGNRISIIFQDAMTSLNPTWTIGNQLREAILTHAKNPHEKELYDAENALRSDIQRIASLHKGISHHPDSQLLKDDLAFVEQKKLDDEATLKRLRAEFKGKMKKLKAETLENYRKGKPAYDEAIKQASIAYSKGFLTLDPIPSEEATLATKEGVALAQDIKAKQESLEKQKVSLERAKAAYLNAENDEEKEILRLAYKSEKYMLEDAKEELSNAKKALHRYMIDYRRNAVFAPRNRLRKAWLEAIRARKEFRMNCLSAYKETKESANAKALKMLEEVGITEPEKRMKQYPFELSGGMLQRCMIAMALVERPDILIADEPTTALDVTIQAQILELLKKLQKEYGMAIIIITHDLGVVAQICDKVNIMYAGRIVERGNVRDVFYSPQHEYTKGLLNSMPKLNQQGKLEPIQGNPVDLFCLPKGCAFSSRCAKCMQLCIDSYPEEVSLPGSEHAASCWRLVKRLHEEGDIDVTATPEGKPLRYNGAIIRNDKKKGGKKNAA